MAIIGMQLRRSQKKEQRSRPTDICFSPGRRIGGLEPSKLNRRVMIVIMRMNVIAREINSFTPPPHSFVKTWTKTPPKPNNAIVVRST